MIESWSKPEEEVDDDFDIDCQKQIGFWNENSEGYISNKMHDLDVIKNALEFQTIKVIKQTYEFSIYLGIFTYMLNWRL